MTKDKDIAISLDGVCKTYKIFKKPSYRILEAFYPGKKTFHRPFKALDDISFSVDNQEALKKIAMTAMTGTTRSMRVRRRSRMMG